MEFLLWVLEVSEAQQGHQAHKDLEERLDHRDLKETLETEVFQE
jgi:hypothetical protein